MNRINEVKAGDVIALSVCDYGSGYAQVKKVTEMDITLQWALFSKCYDCMVFNEDMYYIDDVISKNDILQCDFFNIENIEEYRKEQWELERTYKESLIK